ncbi:MAG TPA: PEP-CTERM sorting domain-containing protein, partial [Phycisphaeraceae bacterium]
PAGYGSPIGGQAVLNANNSASVRAERQLAASIDTNPLATQTIYLSVLFRRDDATNGGGTENSEYLRLDDASNVRVATVGQTSGEAFRLQLGSAIVETGIGSVDIGADYLLIAKLTLNPAGTDDTLEAQLFTASDAISEPVTWQGSISSDLSSVATKFVVSQARFAEVLAVDEIRIGDTFADVAAVPEPASLAALAALGLLTASRRPQRG